MFILGKLRSQSCNMTWNTAWCHIRSSLGKQKKPPNPYHVPHMLLSNPRVLNLQFACLLFTRIAQICAVWGFLNGADFQESVQWAYFVCNEPLDPSLPSAHPCGYILLHTYMEKLFLCSLRNLPRMKLGFRATDHCSIQYRICFYWPFNFFLISSRKVVIPENFRILHIRAGGEVGGFSNALFSLYLMKRNNFNIHSIKNSHFLRTGTFMGGTDHAVSPWKETHIKKGMDL